MEGFVYPRAHGKDFLRRKDVWALCEGPKPIDEAVSSPWLSGGNKGWKLDPSRMGAYIYQNPLTVGLGWLIEKLVTESQGVPKVLVATPLFFPEDYASMYDEHSRYHGETYRQRTLRWLVTNATGRDVRLHSSQEYVAWIHAHCSKLLMVHNSGGHFNVFELVFESHKGQYIKIWDGLDSYRSETDPGAIPETT